MISALYRYSPSENAPLRIGVMLDGITAPRTFAAVLEDIAASNFAKLELVIMNADETHPTHRVPRSKMRRLLRRAMNKQLREGALFDAYCKWDENNVIDPDPISLTDITGHIEGVDRIDVKPIVKGFVHRFPPQAVEAVRLQKLDVILRFGFNILRGDILTASTYGVWSYHHGDNEFYRGGPAHLWEMAEGKELSGVILQVLSEDLDAGFVLCKALFSTKSFVSLARNRFGPYWGTVHFVIWKLYELHRFGWDFVKSRAIAQAPYQGKEKIYRRPKNMAMVKWLGPIFARKLADRAVEWDRDLVADWRIGVRVGHKPLTNATPGEDLGLNSVQWFPSAAGRFYADPCLLEIDGQFWLFFEDFDYRSETGRISVAPISAQGALGEIGTALNLPHHLSYPMVFHYDGEIFMIPESAAIGRVELYRATQFPFEWKLEKVLYEGLQLVDTTPFLHGGRWYFFTTVEYPDDHCNIGLLFNADCLTCSWRLHPASPIANDVRYSRGAGAIICNNGRLIRPTQDCSRYYGYSFRLNTITTLNPEEFSEERGIIIEPHNFKDLNGVHTYHQCGLLEVFDGFKRLPRRTVLNQAAR